MLLTGNGTAEVRDARHYCASHLDSDSLSIEQHCIAIYCTYLPIRPGGLKENADSQNQIE